jgi:hypothetical protein
LFRDKNGIWSADGSGNEAALGRLNLESKHCRVKARPVSTGLCLASTEELIGKVAIEVEHADLWQRASAHPVLGTNGFYQPLG